MDRRSPSQAHRLDSMLDERHPPLPRFPGDDNLYTLSRIANHNVSAVTYHCKVKV